MLNGSRRHELEELPSIILLDINMPKMNGIEFLKKLREIPKLKQTIVVVLTTSDDERDIVRAYDYNVAGYVLKPVSYDDFVKTMATIGLYWENNKLPQDAAHDRNT